MRLIMIGAPGAGKGTQAEVLAGHFGVPTLSTGALLRQEITSGTELGKLAQSLIDDGNFVPDEVINPLAFNYIQKADNAKGYILDGYPRNLAQAEQFEEWAFNLDAVIYLKVNDDAVVNRLSGRRVCDKCGNTYHAVNQPSARGEDCECCEGKLVQRKDDRPETVRLRLETYRQQTFPVIEFYKERGKLREVACTEDVQSTFELILKALEEQV